MISVPSNVFKFKMMLYCIYCLTQNIVSYSISYVNYQYYFFIYLFFNIRVNNKSFERYLYFYNFIRMYILNSFLIIFIRYLTDVNLYSITINSFFCSLRVGFLFGFISVVRTRSKKHPIKFLSTTLNYIYCS